MSDEQLARDDEQDAGVCHYCDGEQDIQPVEDWQSGEVVKACSVCRRDFDLDAIEEGSA